MIGKRFRKTFVSIMAALTIGVSAGFLLTAQQSGETTAEPAPSIDVEHPECVLFGPKREKFVRALTGGNELSTLTEEVTSRLPELDNMVVPGGSRTNTYQRSSGRNTIDRYVFAAMADAGVSPAPPTNDFEFIRRVTLDLTGRVPTPERVLSFVAEAAPDKRARLVDELLAKPEWVDKWTMFFGDLYANVANNTNSGIVMYPSGRNAFYQWIKTALTANRRYNQMVSEIISATGTNSYEPAQGQINWLVNGQITNGPVQDAYDQEAANVAETFLGLGHMNCILCHNGRGHLDSLSLWGKTEVRTRAWGMAAFMAKTVMTRRPVDPAQPQPYYWSVQESGPRDYQLNTTTGNRPARCANGLPAVETNGVARCTSTGVATPIYPFSGGVPRAGESYRTALAREVTADFQFARATVNYLWKEFFGRGIVEPVNQFDPSRLDPDNPPPAPWTLQPSNARLLNALAQDFINSGYDLQALMRQITNSEAYQLSSRYPGTWDPLNEKLFARKLVRRLWAEEIHDAIVQTSNVIPRYTITGLGTASWAMQLPEPRNMPGGAVTAFLDAFLRGNRDGEERRGDASLSQALGLMNDTFVTTRTRATGTGATASLVQRYLGGTNEQLVSNLYLAVLSRYPSEAEKSAAMASLGSGNRTQKAEDLLWSLYNKVDFLFNY